MITTLFLLVLSATFADKVISADQLSAGAKDFISPLGMLINCHFDSLSVEQKIYIRR